MWQVESCRHSCNHGLAYSRCNTFHLVLRACKQAASVPSHLPTCLFVHDDGGYFGLALLSDRPSVIRQRITAAQSRPSQIETHVNRQLQESASHSVKHPTRPRDIFRRVSRRTDGQLVHYRPPHSDVETGFSASLRTSLQSRGQAGRH